MVCKNCGEKFDSSDMVCPRCGVSPTFQGGQFTQLEDNGGFLWGALGCCIPIAGLILFLVWKDIKPKTAKAAGKGALVSLIAIVASYIFVIILGLFLSVI
ncbi:MAG: zinc ribbon domain-containing protein [Anaerotignaceae bacterium]